MCRIAGIWSPHDVGDVDKAKLNALLKSNSNPVDASQINTEEYKQAVFGQVGNKIFIDPTRRYAFAFCGNAYNLNALNQELKTPLEENKATTEEVILQGLIHEGISFAEKINGDFVFSFYDSHTHTLYLVRDKYGTRSLYYSDENTQVIFGSTLNGVAQAVSKKEINTAHLATYLQLSYSPAPQTVLKNVYKLEPGHYLKISTQGIEKSAYYRFEETLPFGESREKTYIQEFKSLLADAVKTRLEGQKRIGTFLSGGIDSSVISLLAHRYDTGIPAFSLGFPDNPFFDEAERAQTIARHLGMEHHLIQITNREITREAEEIFTDFDEPFADSSAILVKFLCRHAQTEVDAALSGDGADEIMGGYNKHRALLRSLQANFSNGAFRMVNPLLSLLPESRNSKTFNALRKAKRYSQGLTYGFEERYLSWSSFTPRKVVNELLLAPAPIELPSLKLDKVNFNTVLQADTRMVLAHDMLHKIDLMGLRKSLDVRAPFIDPGLVDFLFKIPASKKLNTKRGKLILYSAYEADFPAGFFQTSKKGFEAPLSEWLQGPLAEISNYYLSRDFLKSQGIFSFDTVKRLALKAKSDFPGDTPHTLWAVLVFQAWYSKHFMS